MTLLSVKPFHICFNLTLLAISLPVLAQHSSRSLLRASSFTQSGENTRLRKYFEILGRFEHERSVTDSIFLKTNLLAISNTSNESTVSPIASPWRSKSLQRIWHQPKATKSIAVDQLYLTYEANEITLKTGRFPINLSSTNVFSPNDLFQPYYATQFYRTYKPGVDGLRISRYYDYAGRIEFIGVAGYSHTTDENNNFDAEDSAYLALWADAYNSLDFQLVAGNVSDFNIAAVGAQMPLTHVTLRGEANAKKVIRNTQSRKIGQTDKQLVLGIEGQIFAELMFGLEKYYNHRGTDQGSLPQRNAEPNTSWQPYLAKNYTSAHGSLILSGVSTLQLLTIINDYNNATLSSLYLNLSTSDNTEVSIGMSHGRGPSTNEFKLAGKSASLSIGSYF